MGKSLSELCADVCISEVAGHEDEQCEQAARGGYDGSDLGARVQAFMPHCAIVDAVYGSFELHMVRLYREMEGRQGDPENCCFSVVLA